MPWVKVHKDLEEYGIRDKDTQNREVRRKNMQNCRSKWSVWGETEPTGSSQMKNVQEWAREWRETNDNKEKKAIV